MPCYSTSVIVHIVSRSTFEHWSELTSSLVCDLCLWFYGPISRDTRLHGSRPTNKLQSFAALFTLCILYTIHNAELLFDIRPSILLLFRFFQSCIFMYRIFSVPIINTFTYHAQYCAPGSSLSKFIFSMHCSVIIIITYVFAVAFLRATA